MTLVNLLCSSSGLSECGPQAECSALLEQLSCAKIVLGYVYPIISFCLSFLLLVACFRHRHSSPCFLIKCF